MFDMVSKQKSSTLLEMIMFGVFSSKEYAVVFAEHYIVIAHYKTCRLILK